MKSEIYYSIPCSEGCNSKDLVFLKDICLMTMQYLYFNINNPQVLIFFVVFNHPKGISQTNKFII